MYEHLALGFVLASVGPLFVVGDWGVVEESFVSISNIRFDRHNFFVIWYGRLLVLGSGR